MFQNWILRFLVSEFCVICSDWIQRCWNCDCITGTIFRLDMLVSRSERQSRSLNGGFIVSFSHMSSSLEIWWRSRRLYGFVLKWNLCLLFTDLAYIVVRFYQIIGGRRWPIYSFSPQSFSNMTVLVHKSENHRFQWLLFGLFKVFFFLHKNISCEL